MTKDDAMQIVAALKTVSDYVGFCAIFLFLIWMKDK